MLVVLLVVQGGTALAASDASTASVDLQGQSLDDLSLEPGEMNVSTNVESVSVVEDEIAQEAAAPAVEEVLVTEELSDETISPAVEHLTDGCGGNADAEKLKAKIDLAAEILGLTPEEINTQVANGLRLYEIAAAQGYDMEAFKQTMHSTFGGDGCDCGAH